MSDECAPIDITLTGYQKAKISPEPTDGVSYGRALIKRVVLTPQQPRCIIKLAGGREIEIRAWANRATGLEPACRHAARVMKLEQEVEALREALERLTGVRA